MDLDEIAYIWTSDASDGNHLNEVEDDDKSEDGNDGKPIVVSGNFDYKLRSVCRPRSIGFLQLVVNV